MAGQKFNDKGGERMKQQILNEISAKFSQLNIPLKTGTDTDFYIENEFFDAAWGTGSKKINYQTYIFANEQDSTIYMYELTEEKGNGISFGGDSETSFQSGTTLFRKVKGIRYSPDGQSYEYSLDLGAIPKAVKETAKQYGWKFKTVISKAKACYPKGYINRNQVPPAQNNPTVVTAPHEKNNKYCSKCGSVIEPNASFCSNCGAPTALKPVSQPIAQPLQNPPQYTNQPITRLSQNPTQYVNQQQYSPNNPPNQKKKMNGCLLAFLITLAAIGGLFLIIFILVLLTI